LRNGAAYESDGRLPDPGGGGAIRQSDPGCRRGRTRASGAEHGATVRPPIVGVHQGAAAKHDLRERMAALLKKNVAA